MENTLQDGLRDGVSLVAEFVPKLLLFLIILVVGLLIAKAVSKALSAILERVGFDRAVERGGVKRAMANSKMDASDVVAKLIYYTLMLFVLQLAFSVFGPNAISDLIERVITFLPSLIVAIVILFLGVVAALNQVGVATTVTLPVLVAILATVAGVIIVGVGGGLIRPMQQRWEGYLSKAEEEAPRMKQHAADAPSVTEQAQQARDRVQGGTSSTSTATRTQPVTPADGTHRF